MKVEKSTKYVIDASLILGFLLPDEYDIEAFIKVKEFVSGNSKFIAPTLLPYEIINGLKNAIQRNRVTLNQALELTNQFIEFMIPLQEIDLDAVLKLAQDKDLSVYDASYLYLSKEKNLELLTLDKQLKYLI